MRFHRLLPFFLALASGLEPALAADWDSLAREALGNRRGTVVLLALDGKVLCLQRPRLAGKARRPGSVAKLVSAAAFLEEGIGPDHAEVCRGVDCWRIHGKLGLTEAIARSCSQYFYRLGASLNPRIYREARAAGFGQSTGLLEGEEAGMLDPHARLACGEEGWLSTPLQWAVLAGAIANGGTRYRPYLRGKPQVLGHLPWKPRTLAALREGMKLAVDGGSAQKAAGAGKTGTVLQDSGRSDGWFVGFAPRENPRVALCLFVEGGTGYEDAAPIARRLFENV
ncbi:MAG: penicillin-binding transpeptidase domain-containing protein, partial [Bacteroidota bacterium]